MWYICPESPLPPFFIGWFPSFTIILVKVYYLPKGSLPFCSNGGKDFQGGYI